MFVVFDLDGTLALTGHRDHLVRGPEKSWDAFYAACGGDAPNEPVIRALQAHARLGDRVEIWTGRREDQREETRAWLRRHGLADLVGVLKNMRPAGDVRPDVELKSEWLAEAAARGRAPQLAYEDRDRVVAMWRAAGVACFQVAPGAF